VNEQRQALLDALGAARLPEGGIAWSMVMLALLVAIGLLVGIAASVRWARRHRRAPVAVTAWTDEAREMLARLGERSRRADEASDEQVRDWLAEAAQLARRVALVDEPREEIAALHGEAWLQRLDALVGRPLFSVAPVSSLASAPYRPVGEAPRAALPVTHAALEALIEAVEQRGRTPASTRS